MSDYSDNEDDPAVYESSGDEWNEVVERKGNKRRISHRLSKRPRITHIDTSDSDEDDIPISKNGVNRKSKKPPTKIAPAPSTKITDSSPEKQSTATNSNFVTGTFVISKKDAQEGNISSPPSIWKIDGKALLQKFEPFEDDGKVRYRNTSIYTGWTSADKENYASIHVQMYIHSGQKMILEIDWDQLKTITIDSD